MQKLQNREQFILTEYGLKWLKIDTANTFGVDKLTHEEQIAWFDENIKNKDFTNLLIEKAESPFEFKQCLENYEDYLAGKPVRGLCHVDCSNQALQIYAVLTGDLQTAKVCNMAGEIERADAYQMLADSLNSHFSKPFVTRKMAKKPMMTTLYGKQKAWDTMLDEFAENLRNTNVYDEEFQSQIDEIFKESMHSIAPKAMEAMSILQKLNDENIGTYYWTLPDGFKVRYDVKATTDIKAERVSKTGLHLSIEDTVAEYKPHKYNAGMAPNVIHSVDGYVARQVILRNDFHVTTIHDDFACHYNFVDKMITVFEDVLIELLHSDLLNDIMSEIADGRTFVKIDKSNTLNRFHIRKSEYHIS